MSLQSKLSKTKDTSTMSMKGPELIEDTTLLAYFLRFCTVGVAATVTYFLVANLLMFINITTTEISSVLAYMVGIVISYFGQSSYTFRVTDKNHGQFLRFSFLSLIGLCISYLSVSYAVNFYHVKPFWGTIVTSVSIPILSFFVMKVWVFKK